MSGVRREGVRRCPRVRAAVADVLRNVGDRLHVGAWALEKDERYGTGGCGLRKGN